MALIQVAMHELKAGLSRYVAKARAGQVIEVTSHNKAVARLVGMPAAAPSGVAGLVARGAASWGGGKPSSAPPVVLPAHPSSMSELIAQDRG